MRSQHFGCGELAAKGSPKGTDIEFPQELCAASPSCWFDAEWLIQDRWYFWGWRGAGGTGGRGCISIPRWFAPNHDPRGGSGSAEEMPDQ